MRVSALNGEKSAFHTFFIIFCSFFFFYPILLFPNSRLHFKLYSHHQIANMFATGASDMKFVARKGTSSWKFITFVAIVLIYGSVLLISEIKSLYVVRKTLQTQDFGIHSVYPLKYMDASDTSGDTRRKPLTLQDLRNGTFLPETKDIQWISTPTSLIDDSGDFVVVENDRYYLKSLNDSESSTLLYDLGTNLEINNVTYNVEDITFSNDLKIALLTCNKVQNWRHSYFASYLIYNVETKDIRPLIDGEDNKDVALAVISPDSSKISYVLRNNIYITDISNFGVPETRQITSDGSAQIFNGKPDWVYEEEVFESDTALWWSPDSSHLAFLHSNDTEVPEYPITYFARENPGDTASYPSVEKIKYPKAGFPNPIVDILIYDCNHEVLKYLPEEDPFYNDAEISNLDRLITEVTWVGNEQALVRVTNRESDVLKIFIISCPSNTLEVSSFISRFLDGREEKSWFEISHNTMFIPKSENRKYNGYIDVIDVDGYDHLAYFAPPESSEPSVILTTGEWEVVNGPVAYDHVLEKLYYVSTEKSSMERHVYSIGIDGKGKTNITNTEEPAWYDVSFSKGARYLLLSNQGPNVPYQIILDLHKGTSTPFTENHQLEKILEEYEIPETIYGNITLKDGTIVNCKETLPLNFDKSNKYPLLFFVYGGPGSQLVQKSFAVSFSSIIAAEFNTVVVTVDGRGTGFRGKKFRNIVRDNLGYFEVNDQVQAAEHWISRGYIDKARTAIWGWSYGGYMTLKTMEFDAGKTFKFGMSVAPVTDWKLYDSVYTERYMHTPQQNPGGYEDARVSNVTNFKGVKRFLIMHGTGDDNVHFQNTMQLIDAFDIEGVENYDMHVFPDSDHSIRWHNAGTMVYNRLFTWLGNAFSGEYENAFYLQDTLGASQYGFDDFIDLYG